VQHLRTDALGSLVRSRIFVLLLTINYSMLHRVILPDPVVVYDKIALVHGVASAHAHAPLKTRHVLDARQILDTCFLRIYSSRVAR